MFFKHQSIEHDEPQKRTNSNIHTFLLRSSFPYLSQLLSVFLTLPINETTAMMKLVLLALLAPTASAFSAYLSQLSSPNNAVDEAVNGGAIGYSDSSNPSFFPPPTSHQSMMTATTEGGASQEMLDLISKQVSVELMASQSYMSASIWFRNRQMDGMAAWMLEESDEERGHGKQILEFAMKCSFPVTLEPLEAPQSEWQSPADVWATILGLEENNTRNLLKIAEVANQCHQFGVVSFLGPFHEEQIDAEAKVGSILAKVRGASESFLWEIDHQLAMEAEEEEHH